MADPRETEKRSPRSRAAAGLRKLSLAAADGDFLGSETELLQLLGVSRPTFRQAARLVAHDQLVEIRMGPHGGCYARRPNGDSVVRSAAMFLHLRHATLLDALRISCELDCFSAVLACENRSAPARGALETLVKALETAPDVGGEPDDCAERQFGALMALMADNPIVTLMHDVVARFLATDPASVALKGTPPMVRARRGAIARQGRAILAGDADMASAIIRQQFEAYSALIPVHSLERRLALEPLSVAASSR
ncbi:FadR/GntR family transcriptional regulator [Sphingobium baderi]|uniref:FadR/GntR family transcriptional regulator n=1 Tax=Sphingobium baderi TaxID=1332080 RepID=UPI000AF4C7D6|nr:FCD domain-containing protein [Sphingobium baderi]WRD75428.1 FCD domain-containing protein [Sphingobium baderi]